MTPAHSFVYYTYPSPESTVSESKDLLTESSSSSTQNSDDTPRESEPKKRRQQSGYACNKCRERRVGCDRNKPFCGQCRKSWECKYSNDGPKSDNISMRQRLDDIQATVQTMSGSLGSIEQKYHNTISRLLVQIQPQAQQGAVGQKGGVISNQALLPDLSELTVAGWATHIGWPVVTKSDGTQSIQTNFHILEDLKDAMRQAVRMNDAYYSPSPLSYIIREESPTSQTRRRVNNLLSFSLFERLGRLDRPEDQYNVDNKSIKPNEIMPKNLAEKLVHQNHQCGFPILVSPVRFEAYHSQGRISPLVISSVLSHAVPHIYNYHPNVLWLHNSEQLGEIFYKYSREALQYDEATLTNIHQRTLLITYDLDIGRVERAYLHLGIAARMCFSLDLHTLKGYIKCKSPFEREQAKRIFWTVWFLDSMVPQLYKKPSSIDPSTITVEPPTVLPDFSFTEAEQARFVISIIGIRRLSSELTISQNKAEIIEDAEIDTLKADEERLREFYRTLDPQNRYAYANQMTGLKTTQWSRRTFYCVLLDFCQCWITLYRPYLPVDSDELTEINREAILRTSQAAVATAILFDRWFSASIESLDGFDCFFRPYLYHYMSAIQTLKVSDLGQCYAGE
ncbi:hypothetical protein CLU79DRAFT_455263 [Phycomyces nitens]|nr:hypothetical protein CLU79DRAFT_455263 [Phycomyces nitens]